MERKLILIIAEDAALSAAAQKTLAQAGARVLTATGHHGLHEFEAYRPDVVLLDIRLPAAVELGNLSAGSA